MRASTTVTVVAVRFLGILAGPSVVSASTEGCVSERGRGLHPDGYDIVVAGVIVANVPDPDQVSSEGADPWKSGVRPVITVTVRPVAAWKGVPPGTTELELSTPSSASSPGFEVGSFRLVFADDLASDDDGRLPRVAAYCSHLRSVSDIHSPKRLMRWLRSPQWYLAADDGSPTRCR